MTYTMPPWSFSSLNAFETCPRRYFKVKVEKSVSDDKTVAATWGNEVHKHLENRIKDNKPLPQSISAYESMAATIANHKGRKLVESQMAVDYSLTPTGWMDKNVWCRGIVDTGVLTCNRAVLLDWKTGKRKPDSDQLALFAGLTFAHYPDINTVTTGFIWLKDDKIDQQTFERRDVPTIWQRFIPRVQRMERAFSEGKFPPKPSGLCNKYCPVPHSQCEFSGRNRT